MKKSLFTSLLAIVSVASFGFVATTFAQDDSAPKVVQDYVARQGKKQKVPAEVNKIVKGDLNGDKTEDLAVQYYVQIGYPGNATTIATAVFLQKNGKYIFAAETADNTVPDSITGGKLIANKYSDNNINEVVATMKYKLVGRRLVKTK